MKAYILINPIVASAYFIHWDYREMSSAVAEEMNAELKASEQDLRWERCGDA